MHAAQHGMQLADTRHFHCLACGVDHAGVSAGSDHHQAAVLHVEAGAVLVEVLVGYEFAAGLGVGGWHVTAHTVSLAVLDLGIRQHALEAAPRDAPRSERMTHDHRRLLAINDLDLKGFKIAPVEYAPVAEVPRRPARGLAVAEIVLAADVESEIGRQLVAVLLQEADDPAEMVVVSMAEDHALYPGAVYAHDLHVVEQGLRR